MSDLISRADAIEAVENNSYGMGSRASVKAIKALPSAELPKGDLISRADAIEVISKHSDLPFAWWKMICRELQDLPSADAEVSDYAKWLEDIIVKAETLEWLCEDTPWKEWCDENCNYTSIQAECLRHLYDIEQTEYKLPGHDEVMEALDNMKLEFTINGKERIKRIGGDND